MTGVAFDESRPLPVSVPSMPLKLKVILVGERESLADFQEMEPELAEQAIYSEFEDNLQIADAEAMTLWCQWVTRIALRDNLPPPAPDAWPVLIREAVRYTGEQDTLPLCPLWIARQFKEAFAFMRRRYLRRRSAQPDACPTRMARRLSGGADAG
ncbi:protease [Salmonella enterica subsp. enterica]|uniref:Protease n=1 Tax=Salmonella enterica I TaxID=59201 RepID=A0A447PMI1_SALET|nr:protease [Salmonella enterica subsp. enterica]